MTREIGYSIIPLKLYLKHGQCKVLLGVARGKKKYDKRQALKEKAVKRDIDRAVKAVIKQYHCLIGPSLI